MSIGRRGARFGARIAFVFHVILAQSRCINDSQRHPLFFASSHRSPTGGSRVSHLQTPPSSNFGQFHMPNDHDPPLNDDSATTVGPDLRADGEAGAAAPSTAIPGPDASVASHVASEGEKPTIQAGDGSTAAKVTDENEDAPAPKAAAAGDQAHIMNASVPEPPRNDDINKVQTNESGIGAATVSGWSTVARHSPRRLPNAVQKLTACSFGRVKFRTTIQRAQVLRTWRLHRRRRALNLRRARRPAM